MQGYREAEKIDGLIYKLYEKESLCPENAREWMAFARTISSGLNMIEREALELLLEESGKSREAAKEVNSLLKLSLVGSKLIDT